MIIYFTGIVFPLYYGISEILNMVTTICTSIIVRPDRRSAIVVFLVILISEAEQLAV